MSTVAEQTGGMSFDLEQAQEWINKMAQRGIYQATTARLRATAIERLASVLGEEEPRAVAYFLDRIGDLTSRWMKKENGNPETAVTYRSRAKVALEDFLGYQADPTGWRPRNRGGDTMRKTKEPELALVEEDAHRKVTPPSAVASADRCVLGEGAEFRYFLPDRGLEVRDVLRIAVHLMSMTRDFDLADPLQRNLFTLARGEQ